MPKDLHKLGEDPSYRQDCGTFGRKIYKIILMKKCLSKIKKIALGFGATIVQLLSLPPVRNFIWGKMINKGETKIVEAKARIVEENKKKKGLFRR
jgi:hypothetical protein